MKAHLDAHAADLECINHSQTMWMPEDRPPFSTWEHPTILRRQKRETEEVNERLLQNQINSDTIGMPLAGYPQVRRHNSCVVSVLQF